MNSHQTSIPLVRLGRTGLAVSRLALGAVELGLDYGIPVPGHFGKPGLTEAVRLVHCALNAGINLIDTARAYGASEEVLGKALRGRRAQVVLASKVTTQPPCGEIESSQLRKQMQTSLHETLTALNVDTLDIWQIHNVDAATLTHADTIAKIFAEAKSEGKIRFTGGSFYGPHLPLYALDTGLFDVMQVTYSVFDQRIADEFLMKAASLGVGVIVRSILLKGVLTARAEHLPATLEPLRLASRRFRQLVDEHLPGVSPPQAAIAFGLSQPNIHTILIGVRSEQEITENVQAARIHLPESFMQACRTLRIDDPDLLNPSTWGIP